MKIYNVYVICLKIILLFFLLNFILKNNYVKKKRVIRDVLFVNGCHSNIPHPYRYRVLHQIEQLKAANLNSFDLYYFNDSSQGIGCVFHYKQKREGSPSLFCLQPLRAYLCFCI